MMPRSAPPSFPEALDDDDDDVTWALETAAVQWKRGAHPDAIEWLRRAAESAVDGGRAIRARELTQLTNALEAALSSGWVPGAPGQGQSSSRPPNATTTLRQGGAYSASRPPGGYSIRPSSIPPAPESPRPFPLRTPRPAPNPFLSPAAAPGPARTFSRQITPFGPPGPSSRPPADEDGAELLEVDAYGELAVDLDLENEGARPAARPPRPMSPSVEMLEEIEPDDDDIEEFDDADVIALSIPNRQRSAAARPPMVSAPALEIEAEEIEEVDALDDDDIEDAELEADPDEDRPTLPPSSSEPPFPRNIGANAGRDSGKSTAPRAQLKSEAAASSSTPPRRESASGRPKAAALLRAQMRTERRRSQNPDSARADARREPEQEEPTERVVDAAPSTPPPPPPPPALFSPPENEFPETSPEETTERDLDRDGPEATPSSRQREAALESEPGTSPDAKALAETGLSSLPPPRDSETPDTEREERRLEQPSFMLMGDDVLSLAPSSSPESSAANVVALAPPLGGPEPPPQLESMPAMSAQRVIESVPARVFVTSSVPTHAMIVSEAASAETVVPMLVPRLPSAPTLETRTSLAPSDLPPSELPPSEVPPSSPSAPPGAAPRPTQISGISLSDVPGLEDLPEESQAELIESAQIHTLAAQEEVSGFGLALVLNGMVAVMPEIADVMAAPASRGELVFCTGHLAEGVAMRVVALTDGTQVASWPNSAFDAAVRDCPWVGDELKNVGDRLQALSGVLMGPMGDQLDDQLRALIIGRCEVRRLLPHEVIAVAGKGVPGMTIVGAGRVEVMAGNGDSEDMLEQLGPGEFLFAPQILTASPAPGTARAGKSGALVLFAERKIAHELMVSVPPLLGIFAQ